MDYYKVILSEHEMNILISAIDIIVSTYEEAFDYDINELDAISALLQHKLEEPCEDDEDFNLE
jgi:hypothetical protein